MKTELNDFGQIAGLLARNPLGIIALFIVLIYGFSAITLLFSGKLNVSERAPLIYFSVLFPFVVLGVFSWLVSQHSSKLFAPSDFRDDQSFMDSQRQAVTAALEEATAARLGTHRIENADILDSVEKVSFLQGALGMGWKRQILWVDDNPSNNVELRRAFEATGITFTLSVNTKNALDQLFIQNFAAVISDVGREESSSGSSEKESATRYIRLAGFDLLDAMRGNRNATPLFFYSSRLPSEYAKDVTQRGQNGIINRPNGFTNRPSELFEMVASSLVN